MSDKLTVAGKIDEGSKTAKAWKCKIGGKSYYCNKDILHLVGRNIIAEYTMSEPYANPAKPGEMVQSKYLLFDSILIQGEASVTPGIFPRPKTGQETPNKPTVASGQTTDWTVRNRQTDRSIVLAYAKDLAVAGKIEVSEIENMATRMFDFIIEKEKEIPF